MPKDLELIDLIAHRRFGELDLWANIERAEIAKALGSPDDDSVRTRDQIHRNQPAPIWKFGDFEFHFHTTTDRLCFVFLETFSGEPKGCQNQAIVPWVIHKDLSLASFQSACDLANIPITTDEDKWNEGCQLVTCALSDATLLFGPNHSRPTGDSLLRTLTVPAGEKAPSS